MSEQETDGITSPASAPNPERPTKLGPIVRLVETYFAVAILTVLAWALLMPPGEFIYDITLVRVVLVMAAAARSVWLIEKRASTARPFIIVTMAIVIVISVLDIFIGGEYGRIIEAVGLPITVAGGILYFGASLFIIWYFAFAQRPKETFVIPLERSTKPSAHKEDNYASKPFTWPWVRNIVLYYCFFSIVGHWAEIGFCWLIVFGIVMGDYDFSHAQLWDWWLCPYPAEGIAVVLIAILLAPFKDWVLKKVGGRVLVALVISFLVNMFVCASIDFTTGITANANYELWDYRGLPFNFMGQVLLQNTLVYSLAATFIVWVVYPPLEKLLNRAPQHIVNGLFVGFVAAYVFLEVLYYVNISPVGIKFG